MNGWAYIQGVIIAINISFQNKHMLSGNKRFSLQWHVVFNGKQRK